jgi:hypothetical protein
LNATELAHLSKGNTCSAERERTSVCILIVFYR